MLEAAARLPLRHLTCSCTLDSLACRVQRKKSEDEEEELKSRPAWVIDNNTYELWRRGVDESMIPDDVAFSGATVAQINRMLEWAASEVAVFKETEAEAETPQPQPQLQPLPAAVPPLQPLPEPAGGSSSWAAAWPKQPFVPHVASEATLALAKSLAAGPRIGESPTTVMGA